MQKVAPIVQFSAPAKEKLVEVMKEQNAADYFLRIDVYATGGCACSGGYKYGMGIDQTPRADDVVEQVEEIKVVTDRNAAEILRGSQIDYTDTVQRRGFKITNPNVQAGGCGCGGH